MRKEAIEIPQMMAAIKKGEIVIYYRDLTKVEDCAIANIAPFHVLQGQWSQ